MHAIAKLSLARQLLEHEAAESQDQRSLIEAAERVSDKMGAHLSKRIGQEGFRTLLGRALALTIVHFPQMSAARVAADGSLAGLRESTEASVPQSVDTSAADASAAGAVALVGHLLELLVTFIGEDLTLRILSTVWPDFALDHETILEKE